MNLLNILDEITSDVAHTVSFGNGTVSGSHVFPNGLAFSLTLPTTAGTQTEVQSGLQYATLFSGILSAIVAAGQHTPAATPPSTAA